MIQLIQTTKEELSNQIALRISEQLKEIKDSIPSPEQILTREETASLLKIDLSTLWGWTKKGKITAYGIGNRVYYKRSEIESSLKKLNY